MNEQCAVGEHHKHWFMKCVSWSSIFVGAFIGLGLSFLLNLFSIAIGLTAFTTTSGSITAVAVGGFIGMAIGVIASMFAAGWAAGYLARPISCNRGLGVLYGFTAWCVALVIAVLLGASVSKYVSTYSAYVTNNTVTVIKAPEEGKQGAETAAAADVKDVAKVGFVLFVLFFLGAISSSFGGYFGMVSRTDGYCDQPRV